MISLISSTLFLQNKTEQNAGLLTTLVMKLEQELKRWKIKKIRIENTWISQYYALSPKMTYLVRKGRQEGTQLRSLRFIAPVGGVAAPDQKGEGRKSTNGEYRYIATYRVLREKARQRELTVAKALRLRPTACDRAMGRSYGCFVVLVLPPERQNTYGNCVDLLSPNMGVGAASQDRG